MNVMVQTLLMTPSSDDPISPGTVSLVTIGLGVSLVWVPLV